MKIIKATLPAWISTRNTPVSFEDSPVDIIKLISLFDWDATKYGYMYVGEADVTLRVFEPEDGEKNAVASLRAKKDMIWAKATSECDQLEKRIGELLAAAGKE